MSDIKRGPINVLWQCGMNENCQNQERPGTHDEYEDARRCVHSEEPKATQRLFGGSQRQWGERT